MGQHIVGAKRFSPYGLVLTALCGETAHGDHDTGHTVGDGPVCDVCVAQGGGVMA